MDFPPVEVISSVYQTASCFGPAWYPTLLPTFPNVVSMTVEPSPIRCLAADYPILEIFQAFTFIVSDYVVALKTLRDFQQLKKFIEGDHFTIELVIQIGSLFPIPQHYLQPLRVSVQNRLYHHPVIPGVSYFHSLECTRRYPIVVELAPCLFWRFRRSAADYPIRTLFKPSRLPFLATLWCGWL